MAGNLFSTVGQGLWGQNAERAGAGIAAAGSQFNIPRINLFGLTPQGIGAAVAGQNQPYDVGTQVSGFYTPNSQVLQQLQQAKNRTFGNTLGIQDNNQDNNINNNMGGFPQGANTKAGIPSGSGTGTKFGLPNEMIGALRDVNGMTYQHMGNDQWVPIRQAGAGGDTGSEDELINQMYSGAQVGLDAQAQALQGQQPLTEEAIRSTAEQQKTPFEQQRSSGLEAYKQQETQTNEAEANALSQARQLYNELSQYNLSRFGSGSSAGPAAMELLGRSTAQTMGQTGSQATENRRQIDVAKTKLNQFVDQTKGEIDKNAQSKIQEAQQWFKERMNEINSNRAQLESDKSARRYEALKARQDFINQIEYQKQTYALQLDTWRQQQESTLANKLQQTPNTAVNPLNILNSSANYQRTVPRAGDYQYNYGTTASGQQYFAPQTAGKNSILSGKAPGKNYIVQNGLIIDPDTGEVVDVAQ